MYFARRGEISTVPAYVVYQTDDCPEFWSEAIKMALDAFDPFGEQVSNALRRLF